MGISLDNVNLFDGENNLVEVESKSRETIERSVAGLDGVISVDLGSRDRKIRQRGVIRARSQVEMDNKTGNISSYLDGQSHTLVTESGQQYDDLRMDSFKVLKTSSNGGWLSSDYEIYYTQLKV